MPPSPVLMSRQPLVLTLQPGAVAPARPPDALAPKPPADPLTLPGKPPSLVPDWPYCRSISRPSTARTRPTENSKSGRNRVRPYHSLSLLRVRFAASVFGPSELPWSKRPEIVTFGAGAWANPGGASIAMTAKTSTAVTVNLRITALLKIVVNRTEPSDSLVGRTSPTTAGESGRGAGSYAETDFGASGLAGPWKGCSYGSSRG